jgi:hypothetical protein
MPTHSPHMVGQMYTEAICIITINLDSANDGQLTQAGNGQSYPEPNDYGHCLFHKVAYQ